MAGRPTGSGPPALAILLPLLVLYGCAGLGLGREEPSGDEDQRLETAAVLVEVGSWDRAERLLRQLASRCENGEEGRRSMLLLTSLLLDPRNPSAIPDSAALMASRYLGLPDAAPLGRPLAEALYVLALELGADPGLRPGPHAGVGALATRFSDCGASPGSEGPLLLPTLEREPLARRLVALRHERDSLAAREPPEDGQLRARNRVLEGRVAELEAELERIRGILRGRDTTSLEPRRR